MTEQELCELRETPEKVNPDLSLSNEERATTISKESRSQ
jgi:hypothetical protein